MNVEHLNVVVACGQAGLPMARSAELPVSPREVPDDLLDAVKLLQTGLRKVEQVCTHYGEHWQSSSLMPHHI